MVDGEGAAAVGPGAGEGDGRWPARRERAASFQNAEALKMVAMRSAQADATAMLLSAEGLSRARGAMMDGMPGCGAIM